jgi:hypothetical protein
MGITHFRSDVKEEGTRKVAFTNASLVVATVGTLKVTGGATIDGTSTLTGLVTGGAGLAAAAGTYIKLGAIYIITGAPTLFTKAAIDLVATGAAGVSLATSIPRGSLFLNASTGMTASQGVYVKVAPATWSVVTTGSQV